MHPCKLAAFGAVLGAFIGDTLTSYVTHPDDVTPALLEEVLKMPGGGEFNLGQVTDVSKLAMCVMQGLLQERGS